MQDEEYPVARAAGIFYAFQNGTAPFVWVGVIKSLAQKLQPSHEVENLRISRVAQKQRQKRQGFSDRGGAPDAARTAFGCLELCGHRSAGGCGHQPVQGFRFIVRLTGRNLQQLFAEKGEQFRTRSVDELLSEKTPREKPRNPLDD